MVQLLDEVRARQGIDIVQHYKWYPVAELDMIDELVQIELRQLLLRAVQLIGLVNHVSHTLAPQRHVL